VKSYVQPFGREKSTILRHQMGRPAVIAGYIKNVQQRTSYVGFFYPLDRRASRRLKVARLYWIRRSNSYKVT
jgi:hypothetical protein